VREVDQGIAYHQSLMPNLIKFHPPPLTHKKMRRMINRYYNFTEIEENSKENPSRRSLQNRIPAPSIVVCDFTPVYQARDLIESLPWILVDLDAIALPGQILDAVKPYLPVWQHEAPLSYHIYTDGSFHKRSPHLGGCGAILIINTERGQLSGGVLSRTCRPTAKAHSAESIAMLWASIIAFQISSFHLKHFADLPFHLELGFDAKVTGQQSTGLWTAFQQPSIQRLCRDMLYVVQHRHGAESIQWTHIRAHQGHTWNEVADMLANHATRHQDMVQNSDLLYALMDSAEYMRGFDWIWALEQMQKQDPGLPHLFDSHLYHFRQETQIPSAPTEHFGQTTTGTQSDPIGTNMVSSFNVLTLDSKKNKNVGTGPTGRHLSLLQQCDEHDLHIVGVQETRAFKTLNRSNSFYHIITSPCRSDGHYGVQIWLHRGSSFCDGGRPFKEEDFRIVWATPNVLAVKLSHPALHCIVIAARAPTSDKPVDEIRTFWHDLSIHVLHKFPGWKVILLCDSNAHVGSRSSDSISTCGAEIEIAAGECFHDWLQQHSFWLPSTWENIHHGDHFTYVTPTGQHQHRLDFVGLTRNWPLDFVATSVAHTIDGSLSRCDHLPIACSLRANLPPPVDSVKNFRQALKHDREATATFLRTNPHCFTALQSFDWSLDVHQHSHGLAVATIDFLQPLLPKVKRIPRKRHLIALTWSILTWKRQLRRHHLSIVRWMKYGTLREIFSAWSHLQKRNRREFGPSQRWVKLVHFKMALLEHALQRVKPILQHMLKHDDATYYNGLAKRAGTVEHEEGLHGLWKEIKGVLPKWRTRRTIQRFDIDDELCQHFAALEAGTSMSFSDLFHQCTDYQNATLRENNFQCYHLSDLPTLFEIEQTCRKTTLARAPGLDSILPEVCRIGAPSIAKHIHNLIMKIACNQTEPVWYKGGLTCPIYKAKGPLDNPASYRGVVLLDTFGKKFHAWLRSRLVPILQQRRTPGQLGGLPSEQTLTGSHLLRTHGQLARNLKLSSAVIFVDVRAAFHHMLRELIFLEGAPGLDLDKVLDSDHFNLETLNILLHHRCSSSPCDFPAPLRHLADDVHRHTWFTQTNTSMGRHNVMATVRGTRPGSPVADVGFNLLMSDILSDLHQRLQEDEQVSMNLQHFPASIPPVTWVDDLAIPLVAMHPSDLIPITEKVLQHVHHVFYSKGLEINYAKGKTEVVVMFRGTDADRHRLAFFSNHQESYVTTSTDTHVFRVRAVASYKHLGIRFQMDSDLNHELHCRLGQARMAFNEVRRPIFRNQSISQRARLQLLHSLIFSKLMYGVGTWYEVPRRVLQKLESAVMRYYRSILDAGFWKSDSGTDAELRARHGLPSLRVMLAVARLRYLQHVSRHAHTYHRELLLTERTFDKGWLYEVEDDLDWMRACADFPDLPPTPDSSLAWADFLQWLRDASPSWKTWLRKALKTHHLRESIAGECMEFHQQIWTTLRESGAILHEPVSDDATTTKHACPECRMVFPTSTGLAVHREKKHGIRCPIKDFVQSEICPGCLKHMWTSQRVIQHLRYRPNRCLDRVVASLQPKGYCQVVLPEHLAKVKRLPASRRHYGPLLPLPHERDRIRLRERLRICEAYGAARDFSTPVSPTLQDLANSRLNQAAHRWLHEDTMNGEQLTMKLVEAAETLPFSHLLIEKCMINWITTHMWDACVEWPPEALQILEQEHYPLLQEIPLRAHQVEREHLMRMLQSAELPVDHDPTWYPPIPHPKKLKRAQQVSTLYPDMAKNELQWKNIVIATPLPAVCPRPLSGSVYTGLYIYIQDDVVNKTYTVVLGDFLQVSLPACPCA